MDPALDDRQEPWQFLRRLARRLVDHHAAEDLAQEAWLATRTSGPAEPQVRRAWLGRVIRNLALNLRRSTRRRTERERKAARPEAVASPDEVRARLELQARIVALVSELEEPYRTAVYLRFYEDLPPREIARRQGISVHTVKTRLQRAISWLRARLDRELGGRSAWCAVLLPLTSAGRPPVPAVASAAVIGGITMKTAAVIGGIAIAVLLGLLYLPPDPVPAWPPVRAADAEPFSEGSDVPAAAPIPVESARQPARTGPAGSITESDWIVAGRVVDPTGSPIAGALVVGELKPSREGVSAITDEAGTYRLALDLPDGISTWAEVTLHAEAGAAGYSSRQRSHPNLRRSDGRGQEVVFDFTLEPQRQARGILVDAWGDPAAHAMVALIDASGRLRSHGRADADGAFLTPVGDGGQVWMAAGSITAGCALTGPHDVPGVSDLDLGTTALHPCGMLEGTLTLPDGRPIPDTQVRALPVEPDAGVGTLFDEWLDEARKAGAPPPRAFAGSSSGFTRTDEQGRFRFEGLAPGIYELEFHRRAGPLRAGPYRTGEHAAVVAEAYRVHVHVVDQQGLAVPGADVMVGCSDGWTVGSSAGLDGRATGDLAPGKWIVRASQEGARPVEQALEVLEGDYEYEVELVLDFQPATGELQVIVTDDRQQRIRAFEVEFRLQDSSSVVRGFVLEPDNDGVLSSVPTGRYNVRVTFPPQPGRLPEPGRPVRMGDHFPVDAFATVREGERSTVRLTTHRGGRLRLWIERGSQESVPVSIALEDVLGGRTRRISYLSEQDSAARIHSGGVGLGRGFTGLIEPGTYVLRATAEGYEDFERTLDVRPAGTTELRIRMQPR